MNNRKQYYSCAQAIQWDTYNWRGNSHRDLLNSSLAVSIRQRIQTRLRTTKWINLDYRYWSIATRIRSNFPTPYGLMTYLPWLTMEWNVIICVWNVSSVWERQASEISDLTDKSQFSPIPMFRGPCGRVVSKLVSRPQAYGFEPRLKINIY